MKYRADSLKVMARLFTVTISEAKANQTEHQIWLLNNISQRLVDLGSVSLGYSHDTYTETASLIELLVQVIAASTGNDNCYGADYSEIRECLEKLLVEYESNFSEKQVKHARQEYKDRQNNFQKELENIEELINSEGLLEDEPADSFFEGDSKRESLLRRKRLREARESREANKKEDA